jgi:glycerol-3-phosphate O-acyltransferase
MVTEKQTVNNVWERTVANKGIMHVKCNLSFSWVTHELLSLPSHRSHIITLHSSMVIQRENVT